MAKKITQRVLATLLAKRAKFAEAEKEITALEDKLLAALKSGSKVQAGVFTAYVKTWERRSVAWKQIVIREQGQEFADRVFNSTKPEKHENLVVETAA